MIELENSSRSSRTRIQRDLLNVRPLELLARTIEQDKIPSFADLVKNPTWHWLYFPPSYRTSELKQDGHPGDDGLLSQFRDCRRMWAGSELTCSSEMPSKDRPIEKHTSLISEEEKQGRSGRLHFATLEHIIVQEGKWLIREKQKLVFKPPMSNSESRSPTGYLAPSDEEWCKPCLADPVLLFRYSALTFNSHRIHYDQHYATTVEGYQGLVVQGPLVATLLADAAMSHFPGRPVVSFSFRLLKPLLANTRFDLCGASTESDSDIRLWTRNGQGEVTAEASLKFFSN